MGGALGTKGMGSAHRPQTPTTTSPVTHTIPRGDHHLELRTSTPMTGTAMAQTPTRTPLTLIDTRMTTLLTLPTAGPQMQGCGR